MLTVNGGETWTAVGPGNSAEMDFRDVHAWDDSTAVIMAAGDPDQVFRTEDGGKTWTSVFEHSDKNAFLDGIAFDKDGVNGWMMGDPLDGHLTLAKTSDSGKTWTLLSKDVAPKLNEGVAGFAASGTNLAVLPNGKIIVGLGGAGCPNGKAQVTASLDGKTWTTTSTPIQSGEAAGIFSIAAVDDTGQRLVAVGGDYLQADGKSNNCLFSQDGGSNWTLITEATPSGYRSVVATALIDGKTVVIAAGPNGTDRSDDYGKTWQRVSETGFHTLSFVPGSDIGWAAGSDGRISRWTSRN